MDRINYSFEIRLDMMLKTFKKNFLKIDNPNY